MSIEAEEWFNEVSPFVTSDFLDLDEHLLGLNTKVLYECMEEYRKAELKQKIKNFEKRRDYCQALANVNLEKDQFDMAREWGAKAETWNLAIEQLHL